MPLLLNNREVAAAMQAGEYVETMEEAVRELGAGRAVNSLRVDTSVPLAGYTAELKQATDARIAALPLDADPVYAPATMAAAKAMDDTVYRLKTITGGYPACGMMAVRISTHFDTQPQLDGLMRRVKLPLGPGWQFMSMVVLLSLETGEVLGMLPDSHIQKMRVGGTTALGVKLLAQPGVECAGVLGSGAQAEAALECTATVAPFKHVKIYSPTRENRERFARTMSERMGIQVTAVDTPQQVAGPGAISVATLVFSRLPYVPARDLAPVSMLVTMPYILVTHPSIPAKNARELIALARANPGKLNMASGGAGTGQHLAGELFKLLSKINMLHIPYKGTAPAIADIMGGHADLTFSDPSVLPQLASGKLKAIGVSGQARYEPLPAVPVIADSGLPGYDAINWYPLMAPAATPREVIARLNGEVLKALGDSGVRERLIGQGLIPAGGSPEQLARFIQEDTRRWQPVIAATGVKLD